MSREILFRGQEICTEKWLEGSLIVFCERRYIQHHPQIPNSKPVPTMVYPETVGQFTGLLDKNGKNIFEGDIVWCAKSTEPEERGFLCLFKDFRWKFNNINFLDDDSYGTVNYHYISNMTEIIGNIHDNPELIKQKIPEGKTSGEI